MIRRWKNQRTVTRQLPRTNQFSRPFKSNDSRDTACKAVKWSPKNGFLSVIRSARFAGIEWKGGTVVISREQSTVSGDKREKKETPRSGVTSWNSGSLVRIALEKIHGSRFSNASATRSVVRQRKRINYSLKYSTRFHRIHPPGKDTWSNEFYALFFFLYF